MKWAEQLCAAKATKRFPVDKTTPWQNFSSMRLAVCAH